MNLHAVGNGHRRLTEQEQLAIVGFLLSAGNAQVRVTPTRIYAKGGWWWRWFQMSRWDLQRYADVVRRSRHKNKTFNPADRRIEWRDA